MKNNCSLLFRLLSESMNSKAFMAAQVDSHRFLEIMAFRKPLHSERLDKAWQELPELPQWLRMQFRVPYIGKPCLVIRPSYQFGQCKPLSKVSLTIYVTQVNTFAFPSGDFHIFPTNGRMHYVCFLINNVLAIICKKHRNSFLL